MHFYIIQKVQKEMPEVLVVKESRLLKNLMIVYEYMKESKTNLKLI